MKKIFTLLCVTLSSLATMANGVEVNGIYYLLDSENMTANVTYMGKSYSSGNNYTGDVVIPDTIVHEENKYAVTSIGSHAFYKCSGLTSVTIPNSVTTIENQAFQYCSGLTAITLPNSITEIESMAFEYCNGLTKTNYIGTIADWCNIKFGGSGANPMYYSHNFYINDVEIKDLVIPEDVETIGDGAFSGCRDLKSVTIGNSVTTIGGGAFRGCSGLTSITIPYSVTIIEGCAFINCNGLTSIDVDVTNTHYASIDGVLFNYAKDTLIQYPIGNTQTAYTIPKSVITIGGQAFYNCKCLTSVIIPKSITTIENQAFYNCKGFTSITCLALEPPSLGTEVFYQVSRTIPLYVYASSVPAYQAAAQWNEFDLHWLKIDLPTPDTAQLSWLPVDSASLYKLRIYSEQIELDTTLLIEADSLNGGISIPITLAPQRVRRMPMDDIGSVVVITLEPNSGVTTDTPFRVTVSTSSKDKIDILFDLEVLKGEKNIKQESGGFALNAPVLDGLEDIPVPRFSVSSGIYDLYGRHYYINQWNQLPAGIYILREGEKACKVMKK